MWFYLYFSSDDSSKIAPGENSKKNTPEAQSVMSSQTSPPLSVHKVIETSRPNPHVGGDLLKLGNNSSQESSAEHKKENSTASNAIQIISKNEEQKYKKTLLTAKYPDKESLNAKPTSNLNISSQKVIDEVDSKPVPKFNLNHEVSFQMSRTVASTTTAARIPSIFEKKSSCVNTVLPKPFTVDSVDTFIDADSPIDYGSLATTLVPIDVDEALGALDSLKFLRTNDTKTSDSNSASRARNEKLFEAYTANLKLNNYQNFSKRQKEINLWQTRKPLFDFNTKHIKEVKKEVENNIETPICPTILEKLSPRKNLDEICSQDCANVEVEIVKGSDDGEDDVSQRGEGEWGSGWTTPLTVGTSSDGNLDEDDGFKTGNSAAGDSEEDEVTWKAEDNCRY